jgi:hypothetical protein
MEIGKRLNKIVKNHMKIRLLLNFSHATGTPSSPYVLDNGVYCIYLWTKITVSPLTLLQEELVHASKLFL